MGTPEGASASERPEEEPGVSESSMGEGAVGDCEALWCAPGRAIA